MLAIDTNSTANEIPPDDTGNTPIWSGMIVYVLLAIHAGMLSWSAARQAPTVDEPVHLSAGVHHWQTGRFDLNRGNPPLVGLIAASPVVLSGVETEWTNSTNSFEVAGHFLDLNGTRAFWLTTLGRWALIPFSLLGAWTCYRWSRELYGHGAGILAMLLWVFCPLLVANGELITGDMAATSVGFTAFYQFWKWLNFPTANRAFVAGILLGLAELAKYVWVVLYLIWPLMWLTWCIIYRKDASRPPIKRQFLQATMMVFLSFYIINWGYLFEGTGAKLARFQLGRSLVGKITGVELSFNAESDSGISWLLGSFPVPLPEDYVLGVDEISDVFDRPHSIYFCGDWIEHGPWYYYIFGFFVKFPLGTITLMAIALLVPIWLKRRQTVPLGDLYLLVCFLCVLTFITSVTTIQYIRYGLPAVPYLLVFASKSGLLIRFGSKLSAVPIAGCAAWAVASSCSVYPHSGSYFNELAGGPARGHELFIESSIDWGQDLMYLKQWLQEHPDVENLHLAYFGRVDPRAAGISFSLPPKLADIQAAGSIAEIVPKEGWYAMSVSLLKGFRWPVVPDGTGHVESISRTDFSYFEQLIPVDRAGYSILIYHITAEDAKQVRDSLIQPKIGRVSPRQY